MSLNDLCTPGTYLTGGMFASFDLPDTRSYCRRRCRISCGPGGAALGAGIGAVSGEALKNADALVEAEETIEALTHGDVSALVAQGMAEHQSGFAEFTSYIKRILIGAAVILGCYLAIPIFVAKRCAQTEVTKSTTRPPFPKPSDQK